MDSEKFKSVLVPLKVTNFFSRVLLVGLFSQDKPSPSEPSIGYIAPMASYPRQFCYAFLKARQSICRGHSN